MKKYLKKYFFDTLTMFTLFSNQTDNYSVIDDTKNDDINSIDTAIENQSDVSIDTHDTRDTRDYDEYFDINVDSNLYSNYIIHKTNGFIWYDSSENELYDSDSTYESYEYSEPDFNHIRILSISKDFSTNTFEQLYHSPIEILEITENCNFYEYFNHFAITTVVFSNYIANFDYTKLVQFCVQNNITLYAYHDCGVCDVSDSCECWRD